VFVYWGLFLILAAGALLSREGTTGRSLLLFIALAALPTLLMIGLRWEIGPDWGSYLDIFNYTKLYPLGRLIAREDPGFGFLLWLLHQAHAPFWILNVICGSVFVAGLTAFAVRQPNPWLAFLIAFPYLVIVVGMSGNRQSLALGFLFFALNAVERGRVNKFVLLIVFAALFHGSVLLVLPLGLLSYSRNNLQRGVLLIFALAVGYYFFRETFSLYARRYSMEHIQSAGVAYRLAMNLLAALIFLLFQGRFGFDEHQSKLWRNFSLCTLVLLVLLALLPSSTAIDRFVLYLFPLQFAVLSRTPNILTSGEGSGRLQLTFVVIAYCMVIQLVFLLFGSFASYYMPYRSLLG
jgi:hypothetical protein